MQEQIPTARRRRRQAQYGSSRVGTSSLLLAGIFLGLIGALVYTWLINPLLFATVTPANFSTIFKEEYLYMISQSYAETGDLVQARARLAALEESDLAEYIAGQLDDYLREGRDPTVVQNLATLAADLGVESPVVAFFGPTPLPVTPTASTSLLIPTLTPTLLPTLAPTVSPSATPRPSPTPSATPRPTITPQPAFRLLSQQRVCRPEEMVHDIEIEVVDAFLEPLPGVELEVAWDGGRDHFFTGFKPLQGPGYADFTMTLNTSYSVKVVEGSPVVSGLRIEPCRLTEGGLQGGWRLVFQKLVVDDENDETP